MFSNLVEVDFIEEIRLRTWARENYVPESDRDTNWHSLILDEMRVRDLETQPDHAVAQRELATANS